MYGVSAFSLQPLNDRFMEVNSKKTFAVLSSTSLHARGHKISLNSFLASSPIAEANLGLTWKGNGGEIILIWKLHLVIGSESYNWSKSDYSTLKFNFLATVYRHIYFHTIYVCVYIYTHIYVSCFWSKFVYLHSPAKVAVFGTWQSTYTHSLLTEIKLMLYLVSSSSFRGSVSKMFFNPLFIHGLFSNPPSPPIFFQHFQGASMLLVLFRSGEYFQRKSCDFSLMLL